MAHRDLPHDRPALWQGRRPLQNLIQQGHNSTMLTGLRCGAGLDAGDIYLKQPLTSTATPGNFLDDSLIEQMIKQIVLEGHGYAPAGRTGLFSRRKPAQSNLGNCPESDLGAWYDQIRMLDVRVSPRLSGDQAGAEFRRVCQRSGHTC